MNKYFLLQYINDNGEDIYNSVELAIFDNLNLCNKEISNLELNSPISTEHISIIEVLSDISPVNNKIKLYCKFNATNLKNDVYLYSDNILKKMFDDDYKYYSSYKNPEVRYKDENKAEIWTEDFVIHLNILELNMNGYINY